MNRLALSAFLLFLIQFGLAHATDKKNTSSSIFHDLSVKTLDGKQRSLSDYKGKVLLVVNTASKCGFTYQYEGLQSLYLKNKDKGFVVLGFPSNDFGGQEPGNADEIQKFCQSKFNVTFPLFEKAPVTGKDKQPVYRFLTTSGPLATRGEVAWNFEKFLVNSEGKVVARWGSKVDPTSVEITEAISQALSQGLPQAPSKER
jgi:glutathione peroxidase